MSRAAQIEFNSWHYVDSDLWVSLASHIFDGLSEELRGRTDKAEVGQEIPEPLQTTTRHPRENDQEVLALLGSILRSLPLTRPLAGPVSTRSVGKGGDDGILVQQQSRPYTNLVRSPSHGTELQGI